MAKIYIATTLSRFKAHNIVRDSLIEQGHEITYDWTKHESINNLSYKYDLNEAKKVSQDEINGVKEADMLVVLLPGGKGTHIELGIALGRNIPVVIHSEKYDEFSLELSRCVFYHDENVSKVVCPINSTEILLGEVSKRLGALETVQ